MKTKIILIVLLITFTGIIKSNSQPRDKIESLRIAIYTEELELTSDEAKVFWPIFNEYSSKLKLIKKEFNLEKQKYGAIKNLSNSQAQEAIAKFLEFEQRELDLKKDYMNKLMKVIPPQKVLKLHKAEQRFKKALLDQIRDAGDQ